MVDKGVGSDGQVSVFCTVFETASIQLCVAKHCFLDCLGFFEEKLLGQGNKCILETALEGLRVTKQQM